MIIAVLSNHHGFSVRKMKIFYYGKEIGKIDFCFDFYKNNLFLVVYDKIHCTGAMVIGVVRNASVLYVSLLINILFFQSSFIFHKKIIALQ